MSRNVAGGLTGHLAATEVDSFLRVTLFLYIHTPIQRDRVFVLASLCRSLALSLLLTADCL